MVPAFSGLHLGWNSAAQEASATDLSQCIKCRNVLHVCTVLKDFPTVASLHCVFAKFDVLCCVIVWSLYLLIIKLCVR